MSGDYPAILSGLEHFLAIRDLTPEMFRALIDFCIERKQRFLAGKQEPVLHGKALAMVFQKSSLRTRLGFEVAMAQLGGHAVNLEDHQIGLTRREDVRDVARVISSMCDGIMARVFGHESVVGLATHSRVPVINGLSDWSHPCQALCDMMTLQEHFGALAGRKLAYIGDGNNVARSLLNACVRCGVSCVVAAPTGYGLNEALVESAWSVARHTGATIELTDKPAAAADGADVIYTDVWTSMGQESERTQREKDFAGFQINAELVSHARPDAVVLHCLPAYRNLEITDEIIDGPQSLIFEQAENRLHSQRALLELLLVRERAAGRRKQAHDAATR